MSRPFSEGEPSTVAELVLKYGGTLSVSRVSNSSLVNVNINLPIVQGLPEVIPCPSAKVDLEAFYRDRGEKLPADFEECKGSMRLGLITYTYPFEKRGVVVRFLNQQTYVCGECGTDSDTEDRTQAIIIGVSLHLMSQQFALKGITMKPPSINRVRNALQFSS